MTIKDGPTDDRPLLLLITTGLRRWREYLLGSIASHFRVHLFLRAEPQWELDYVTGWTVLPDTQDGPAMGRAALELAEKQPVAGVLCWDEGHIHTASYAAEALGLRGGDPAVVWRVRDKGQTRAALDAAGVPQPRSVPVNSLEEAVAAAERVGYPAILKPRGYGASLGVVRVEDEDELRERFPFTHDFTLPDPVPFNSPERVLVEECVIGDEISVDSVIRDGVVTALFVGRKVVGYPPYAEEIGHFVDAEDPLLTDPVLTRILQDTHAALGFRDGWTHSEFMLTTDGPKVIEVNGRLGGDMIPYLGKLATGIDPGPVAAAVACGLEPDIAPTRSRVAAIRFYYVEEEDTTVGSISFDEDGLPPEIDKALTLIEPGAVVSPPPRGSVFQRIALAIAVADSIEACSRALDAAEPALKVTATAVGGKPVEPTLLDARPVTGVPGARSVTHAE
ncbi:MAG: acetyl-CoA carboxylase biotin carboxylase subunit family protein [Frankiaceae bacterium]